MSIFFKEREGESLKLYIENTVLDNLYYIYIIII